MNEASMAMEEKFEGFKVGDIIETRLGYQYRVIRVAEKRGVLICLSLRWPEFDPYTFPIEAVRRVQTVINR